MQHRLLGRTGLRVSPLCFGTMSFGGDADEGESARLYAAVRERGINFLDCADAYGQGRAEEILGRLMAHERDRLIVTTKCWGPMGDDPNMRGSSRRHVTRAVEASLRRLGTDRVEVLFLHRWEPTVPAEETLRALEDLVRAGKVLHVGVSNWSAWQTALGLGVADRHGWGRIDVLQPMYSLVKRQAEVEILPLAAHEGLGVITYSPLGGGLLSGKYGRGKRPERGRLVDDDRYAARYGEAWAPETAGRFAEFARARGMHPVTLAVAWAAGHPAVTAPIIGARSVEQLAPALDALDLPMPPELRAEIAALSPAPPPATDRREESA
jgi:aryl-alcohol dehydrogenase-like predicted oxidoreductase